jgi:hypothetical protein
MAVGLVNAAVTVYSQIPLGDSATATASASAANYTGSAAYDPTILTAPEVPNPGPATQYTIQLQATSSEVQGLSIPQTGHFLGFSIEFSVINQVCELD